jgi:hypothetical protein
MRRVVVAHPSFSVLLHSYSLSVCPSLANSESNGGGGGGADNSSINPFVVWMRNGVTQLSRDSVGALARVICLACDASPTPVALAQNLRHSAAPAFTRLEQITSDQTIDHRSVEVRREISRLLRILRGIAEATSMTNMTSIFDMCVPTMSGISKCFSFFIPNHFFDVFFFMDLLTNKLNFLFFFFRLKLFFSLAPRRLPPRGPRNCFRMSRLPDTLGGANDRPFRSTPESCNVLLHWFTPLLLLEARFVLFLVGTIKNLDDREFG